MEWETVIGLEVHTQLSTQSKIFSGAATKFGAEPNTQACAVDLAFPGVLPVLNQEALRFAVRFGLSIGAHIAHRSVFARKNYFYPDLPKGYQISQFDLPIVGVGHIDVVLDDGSTKRIGITRAHLEEDAGKSMHDGMTGFSGIDLNRAGTPLLEIVSEPDMRSAKEVLSYLKTLHNLVRYLKISDANMQEGSFRCDVNISMRPKGQKEYGTRAEIKNMNSFRFIERAIHFEMARQIELLESGQKVAQETRLYDANKDETRSMRSKEEAHDYRYFPDPDLLPVEITDDYIDSIKKEIPELPWEKRQRFQDEYGLSFYDATLLSNTEETADYFEAILQAQTAVPAKLAANWIGGDLAASLNKENKNITDSPVSSSHLAALLLRIEDKTISSSIAKAIFEAMWNGEGSADKIIEEKGLKQITDSSALEKAVDEIIANNPQQVEQYRAGKDRLISFFVGQVMKATRGKANPTQVNQILNTKLKQ
jgi:aspartyl-tRNA(Asn)/glutamyl-tRNA(Gln) amidotransferase subunit B